MHPLDQHQGDEPCVLLGGILDEETEVADEVKLSVAGLVRGGKQSLKPVQRCNQGGAGGLDVLSQGR